MPNITQAFLNTGQLYDYIVLQVGNVGADFFCEVVCQHVHLLLLRIAVFPTTTHVNVNLPVRVQSVALTDLVHDVQVVHEEVLDANGLIEA